MLSRMKKAKIFEGVGKAFSFLPADAWSLLGLIMGLVSAETIYLGNYPEGALLLLVSGLIDEIDGSVARFKGITAFGGFLDSTSDRIVDGFVFAALTKAFPVAVVALVFSYLVSYTRARAESVIEKCDVGIAERAERLLLLIVGLLTGLINEALVLIAVLAAATTIWRIEHVRHVLKAGHTGKN